MRFFKLSGAAKPPPTAYEAVESFRRDISRDIATMVARTKRLSRLLLEPFRPPLVAMWPMTLSMESRGRWKPAARLFRRGGRPTVLFLSVSCLVLSVSLTDFFSRGDKK